MKWQPTDFYIGICPGCVHQRDMAAAFRLLSLTIGRKVYKVEAIHPTCKANPTLADMAWGVRQ